MIIGILKLLLHKVNVTEMIHSYNIISETNLTKMYTYTCIYICKQTHIP